MNSSRPEDDPFDLPFDPNVEPGNFPWDHWERNAREAGVIEDLVQLGRDLMRKAVHGWSDELRTECGWNDDGAAMIQLAISAPEQTEQRWRYLLNILPFDPNVEPGNFPWDHWERNAHEAGVTEDLVQLGRSLMREAVQHGWHDELRTECGWNDDGAAMIQLAITAPEQAEQRWRYLLYSDGGRVPGDG